MKWISMRTKKPLGEERVDLLLDDGSIIRDAIPQSDGDFYWRNRKQGEIFINEAAVIMWKIPLSIVE